MKFFTVGMKVASNYVHNYTTEALIVLITELDVCNFVLVLKSMVLNKKNYAHL